MTTIAYKDGVLAADTRVTQDDTILPNASKIARDYPYSTAFCGALKVRQDFSQHRDFSKLPDDGWESINGNGILRDSDGATLTIPKGDFWAIGSGAHFALGAMAAGATPEEAVKIAARYDTGTNDIVEVVTR